MGSRPKLRETAQPPPELVPRAAGSGYEADEVASRRAWVEAKTGAALPLVGDCALPYPEMRGNIENPIGAAQMPLGVAGPLLIDGEHARGQFYVPLATTEGALVRSYERGMVTLTRAGGATARVTRDENQISPAFFFDDLAAAVDFARALPERLEALREVVATTTRHGRLLAISCHPAGRQVYGTFHYDTGDAHGMNMIVKATEAACAYLRDQGLAPRYHIFSGLSSEKRPSGLLLGGGKGKTVLAAARLAAKWVRTYLHTTPTALVELAQSTAVGQNRAGALGYNGHFANGLTALFIATGQDVANVLNAATGQTRFELEANGDLYASVTLTSLTVATVGGGTGLGTSRECLAMLDCVGTGKARKLAEITAATLLAGELSFGAAIASGEFVGAHERYGRNRPEPAP